MKQKPRNFKKHPRSVIESMQLIVKAADEKRLCTTFYTANDPVEKKLAIDKGETPLRDGCGCVIGVLLTPDQLEWIVANGCNDYDVRSLCDEVGEDNLMCMTGMTIDQLSLLQREFEDGHSWSEQVLGSSNVVVKRIKQALRRNQKTIALGSSFINFKRTHVVPTSQHCIWDKKSNSCKIVTPATHNS